MRFLSRIFCGAFTKEKAENFAEKLDKMTKAC